MASQRSDPTTPGGVRGGVHGDVPRDVTTLLRRLLADDPGRPRLTWYGPGGERVELSAKVLDNWVAKTANLLVDELDAGPGSRVAVALPAHWRTVTWLLAIWSTGACAVVVPPGTAPPADADVLVAADPALLAAAAPAQAVAVALPALAMSYGPDLPAGALDAASGVRSHGDVFVPFVHPTPDDPAFERPALDGSALDGSALDGSATVVPHGLLLAGAARAADAAGWPPGVRLLTAAAPADAIRDVLGPLVRHGSVVVHHDLAARLASADPDARAALAALRAQEGVTHPPGP